MFTEQEKTGLSFFLPDCQPLTVPTGFDFAVLRDILADTNKALGIAGIIQTEPFINLNRGTAALF